MASDRTFPFEMRWDRRCKRWQLRCIIGCRVNGIRAIFLDTRTRLSLARYAFAAFASTPAYDGRDGQNGNEDYRNNADDACNRLRTERFSTRRGWGFDSRGGLR